MGRLAEAAMSENSLAAGFAATLKPARRLAGPDSRIDGWRIVSARSRLTMNPTAMATMYPMPSRSEVITHGFWPLNAAKVLTATSGLTIGAASM